MRFTDVQAAPLAPRNLSRVLGPFIACMVAFAVLGGVPATAQYTTGSLGGTVIDPAEAVVPGANVTVENEGTGLTKTAVTQSNGAFLFPALPIGSYKLTVVKPGFTTYVQTGITLAVNQAATQTIKLQVGATTQEVTVSANAAILTTRTATLSQKKIVDFR